MSLFTELSIKLDAISHKIADSFKADRERIYLRIDRFAEDYQNEKNLSKSKKKTMHTTLQSINEDDVSDERKQSPNTDKTTSEQNSTETVSEQPQPVANKEVVQITNKNSDAKRASKKRGKDEVDGIFSPELDKRQKRSASVRALSNISKQVKDDDKQDGGRRRRAKNEDSDKENSLPRTIVKVEKMSMATEAAMDVEASTLNAKVEVKKEMADNAIMPPPAAPRPRRAAKDRSRQKLQEMASEEDTGRRTRGRTKKTIDVPPPAPHDSTQTAEVQEEPPVPEARPKRTKKKPQKEVTTSHEKEDTQQPSESDLDTPVKPRTKRTKKAPNKTVEKQDSQEKDVVVPLQEVPKELPDSNVRVPMPIIKKERVSEQQEEISSPILQNVKPKVNKSKDLEIESRIQYELDQTRVIGKRMDVTVTLGNANTEMDETVILPNGRYDHVPVTPKAVHDTNKTVTLDKVHEPILESKEVPEPKVMNETVVLSKDSAQVNNITDDNSLLTNDSTETEHSPPRAEKKQIAPTSAVKEKVQKFEELASRVTRTKTRALAKEMEETVTPPDKVVPTKPVLSAEQLNKMNNMIFNGRPPAVSSSATKPKVNNLVSTVKSLIPNSASKASALAKAREAAEEASRVASEREDAKKKKEKMLQTKREDQRRKREEKMAAAAAAREAAERERRLAFEAMAKERKEKQAHADQGKLERQREAERKKQELQRKVAETEERRRAEEQARQNRLAEDQRRAELARKKQQEEAEATKREAVLAAKEIEKRQKEYIEKQKKQAADKMHTPLRTPGTPGGAPLPAQMEPVHMADGFQYLNSDSDDEQPTKRPVPAWCDSKVRWNSLMVQSNLRTVHVDRLFSVRRHTPDLRELFPNINRHYLKRTSSAVWRTPPSGASRLQPLPE